MAQRTIQSWPSWPLDTISCYSQLFGDIPSTRQVSMSWTETQGLSVDLYMGKLEPNYGKVFRDESKVYNI